jgi:hypothetical protein
LQDDPIWSFQDQYSKKINARTRKLQNGDYIQVLLTHHRGLLVVHLVRWLLSGSDVSALLV